MITSGNIDGALSTLQKTYSGLFEKKPQILFVLRCQQFIDLVKLSKAELALEYLTSTLSKCSQSLQGDEEKYLQQTVGLIAYTNPRQSPLAYLLHQSHADKVADFVNSSILGNISQD